MGGLMGKNSGNPLSGVPIVGSLLGKTGGEDSESETKDASGNVTSTTKTTKKKKDSGLFDIFGGSGGGFFG